MQNLQWINELRSLSDWLWTACTEDGMGEELLCCIQDQALDLLEQDLEGAVNPASKEVLASWRELNAEAAEYITSSDRVWECMWTSWGGVPERSGLPLELTRAFARHRCALAAATAALDY
ncbi:hypothetical protein GCM10028796_04680 [Ramlibacter monticola]|uniref:Uncharacterized protein n=1 Tax=Ramlibacter monticola TaxID=1926872 RepID=A0A937CT37_9BURK|nr:hypothetical protein [Ramlibacter monticola]MBL0391249.1 hypothetical protein [Ramlibacter monticola]